MSLKFLKSLFFLNDKELLEKILETYPLDKIMPILEICQGRIKNLNILMSASLELVNILGRALFIHKGKEEHS